ncbi:MAG: histidinol-phosphate transaminase [Cyclobacteriaceae bacterium]
MESIDQLVRANIKELIPYRSAREQFNNLDLTLLDANENAMGSVGNPNSLRRYPDPYQQEVKAKISQLQGLPSNNIFLGNGSDEIIDLLIRVFCQPGKDEILATAPTYGMYQVSAQINDVGVAKVSLNETFDLVADKIITAARKGTKIIFLCSPNNPTGNLLDQSQIKSVLENYSGIVVIDEAYVDFADQESLASWCIQYPQLVVLQTFSKSWGLAGIRLGMAFASERVIYYLNKVKPPYNVNQLTQEAALLALDQAQERKGFIEEILAQRALLVEKLEQLPIVQHIFPSEANFVLVRMTDPDQIYTFLQEKEVIVRNRSTVVKCEGCLRITVGTQEENQLLLDILEKYPT